MLSDLQLIDLLSEACGTELCFVSGDGSVLYHIVRDNGKIRHVMRQEGKKWTTIWERSYPTIVSDPWLYTDRREDGSH